MAAVLEHTVGQLLALSEFAHDSDERPHLRQVRWTPRYVAATDGFRLLLLLLPRDDARDFGVDPVALRRWLGSHRPSSRVRVIAEPVATPGKPPTGRNALTEQRVVIAAEIEARRTGDPKRIEHVSLPSEREALPPLEKVFPRAALRGDGCPVIPELQDRAVASHGIQPRFLEGIGKVAEAFYCSTAAFELVHAAGPREPILYAMKRESGDLFLLQMPMVA